MFEVICISFAFFFGLLVRQIGLPPLVGFLAAGFAINACAEPLGLPDYTDVILGHLAHSGVLLLLFTIGLKLKIGQLAERHAVSSTLLHFVISTGLFAPLGYLVFGLDWRDAIALAITLSFSSTVLAAKLLESKRELGAFHGRTAISILIVQDVIALGVMALWTSETPSPWALALLGLPIIRPILHRLLDFAGHEELLVLMGMLLALVMGGMGFSALGLSAEIGALFMGVLLSGHPQATDLSQSLWSLRDLLLVCFFLEIGMSGLPDLDALVFALAVTILLPLKGALFFFLFTLFGLRARSSFLAGLSLTNYSEFGLIAATVLLPDWIVPLALAVSFSFLIAAPLNRISHSLYSRFETTLDPFQRAILHPDELPKNLGDARIVIFGMGRTGTAAYDHLLETGKPLIGLDADTYKVQAHQRDGRNVVFADVEDANFWHGIRLTGIEAAILAMDDIEAKVTAARNLRQRGFTGPIASHALHENHIDRILDAGASHCYLTMNHAGQSLADRVADALATPEQSEAAIHPRL